MNGLTDEEKRMLLKTAEKILAHKIVQSTDRRESRRQSD